MSLAVLERAIEAGRPVSGFQIGPVDCPDCGQRATLIEWADAFACEACGQWLDPTCQDPACPLCKARARTLRGFERVRGPDRAKRAARRPSQAPEPLQTPVYCPVATCPREFRHKSWRDQHVAAAHPAALGAVAGLLGGVGRSAPLVWNARLETEPARIVFSTTLAL